MTGAVIERSDFDSDVYGVEFWRVADPASGLLRQAMADVPPDAMVDAKVAADDFGAIAALDALGFRKASVLVEFSAVPEAAPLDSVARGLELGAGDIDAHARAFRFQRLRQDPRVPEAGSVELMRRWIANSLAGRRETLAIGPNFCTYAVEGDRLTIDLLSCLDRGQGIAGRLLRAIRAEAKARGCAEVRVTTEAENVSAMRVYLAAGFRPVAAWAAMHRVGREGT